jgi:hypothetical protein
MDPVTDQPHGEQPRWSGARPRNGWGTAALVLGVVGLFLVIVFIGVLPGLLAVIFGIIGWRRARRGEASNGGVAVAGIVTGALAVVLSIGWGVVFYAENEDEIDNLTECLDEADTDQEAEDCAEEFERDLESGS